MEEKEIGCCEVTEVHENLLKIVRETIPEETELYDLAELFKIFGDSTRIRILFTASSLRRSVRLRSGSNIKHDTVGNFPPASDPEAEPPGEEPQGRKIGILFSGR